jgi:hypothetical protein
MQRTFSGMILLLLAFSTANAALLSRASGQAYYDDVLDITWLANANLADTNAFGVTGINANGTMTWAKANEWIGAMNTANWLGTNDWRLPTVGPLNGSSFNYSTSYNGSTDRGYNQSEQGTAYAGSTASEMAHLFYNTLNNKGQCTPSSVYPSCTVQAGWGLSNTGPFSNLQPNFYWSGTTYAPYPSYAWVFGFTSGGQNDVNKASGFYAWAVRPGDIALVPVPGAVWLFGGALALLGTLRRRAMTALR